jgi:putative peptidoglycan lipid II flippase
VLAGHSLAAFAIGLPVFALMKILTPGFFARGDTMTPLKIGILAVVLNLAMNILFMRPLQAVGPALATSLASGFNAVMLGVILHRRGHFVLDAPAKRRLPRILLAGAVMAAALWAVERMLPAAKTTIPEFLLLVLAGFVSYLGAGVLLGAFDLAELKTMLARRRRAKVA